MSRKPFVTAAGLAILLAGCSGDAELTQVGSNPDLPEPSRGLMPAMTIADPAGWGNRRPVAPAGYTIAPIAADLKIPRQTLVLPNGDILVAEGKGGGNAPIMTPKDIIAGYFKKQGASSVKGGGRLTLLRDADGDGTYEGRAVFAENLNAPYGLALAGGRLYVANQDALVQFAYQPGQIRASGPPVLVTPLPAEINHHWTKSLAASPDGRFLYVGIGSNSNIAERGMAVEEARAIWDKVSAYRLHSAVGLSILLLAAGRIVWRILITDPYNDADRLGWQTRVAHVTALLFYATFLTLPLSGWVMWSSVAPPGPLYLGGVIPWPQVPLDGFDPLTRYAILDLAEDVHIASVILLLVLIPAHVGAALKHHFWDRHDVLRGMLPKIQDSENRQEAVRHKQPASGPPKESGVG